jgi:hypothetical protein
MRSHNDSIDTTHTPPPLSFYNTFNIFNLVVGEYEWKAVQCIWSCQFLKIDEINVGAIFWQF